jgi:hypothetical protein
MRSESGIRGDKELTGEITHVPLPGYFWPIYSVNFALFHVSNLLIFSAITSASGRKPGALPQTHS